jgi:hypothetical protein
MVGGKSTNLSGYFIILSHIYKAFSFFKHADNSMVQSFIKKLTLIQLIEKHPTCMEYSGAPTYSQKAPYIFPYFKVI